MEAMVKTGVCPICNDDGWYAHPEFVDEEKKIIRVTRRPCPNGCQLRPGTVWAVEETQAHIRQAIREYGDCQPVGSAEGYKARLEMLATMERYFDDLLTRPAQAQDSEP